MSMKNQSLLYIGGTGGGDPHYWTFDRYYYTYYAPGQFSMVKVVSQDDQAIFHLQGNLGFNVPWRPSWVSSMAFGVPGVFGYQVSLQ